MAPLPRWADLVPELLCHIFADLRSYATARCVCTAWRRALAPPSPSLLVFAAGGAHRTHPYAASLGTRAPLELAAIASWSRCLGASGDGWLALAADEFISSRGQAVVIVSLLHPVAAVEILLPPLVVGHSRRGWGSVSKVVLAPRTARDDFAAAAICDTGRVAYVTAGANRWAVMEPLRLAGFDYLTDLVYAADDDDGGGGGVVYCLTKLGDVHVLRLPERRRRSPVVDEASWPEWSLLRLRPPQAAESQGRKIDLRRTQERWQQHYQRNNARMMTLPDLNTPPMDPETFTLFTPSLSDDDESKEPDHLNEPATIEPLLSVIKFNPATVFAPPYDTVSPLANAKNLVLCEGNLYQVWRNKSCTVTLNLPAGGQRRVAENEIVVLRYYPRGWQPCWDMVKDLGGHSFFVGRNNAVSMYAKGVPGLKGNCVYWIGGSGRDQAMVFDMESGTSTPCSGFSLAGQRPHSTICWYFLNDVNEHQQKQQQ